MFRHGAISLRVIEPHDLEPMRRLRNDPSTWMNLTDPSLLTAERQRKWYEGLAGRSDAMYFVAFNDEHPFVGIVRMDEIDRVHRSIRVGTDVATELRGRGYGHHIMEAIKKYCFDVLNMHRVWLAVLETNERARKLYAKHGFVEEGRYRAAVFRDGKYVDYVLMSILEEEHRRDSAVQSPHA